MQGSASARAIVATLAVTVPLSTLAGSLAQAQTTGSGPAAWRPQIAIEPMTHVVATTGSGYFSDPYPIHMPPLWINASTPPSFSGTTKEILSCWHLLRPACFEGRPLTITAGDDLIQQAKLQGSLLSTFENNNIMRDSAGQWHMATTVYVRNKAFPDAGHWNTIVHAHPSAFSYSVPTEWVADTLLIGSFSQPAKANYDGKYFEDAGSLYLLYSKRLSDQPARDGIVAQPMQSATLLAAAPPTIMVAPEDANGGYNSELFHPLDPNDQFKLIETGNVTQIDGKYALAYSTGAYDQIGYKTGVAWSDSFLPAAGTFYKKMLKQDVAGVWGQPNHSEVEYLLQAQESDWPHDVAMQVLAPGVPSIVRDASGSWILYFAGYDPSDAPILPGTGDFDPSHRRPYFVGLNLKIPPQATVAGTSGFDLANWIEPVVR